MKYKRRLLLSIAIFSIVIVSAQEYKNENYRIGITSGFGHYLQDDLQELNQEVQSQLEFETELVDNFPPNIYFGGYFLVNLDPKTFIGINYQFHTTGSRLGLKDFSGSYAFDQILSCHSLAIELEESLTHNKKLDFCLDAVIGVNFATWEIKEELIIGGQKESSSTELQAYRPFIFPSFKLKYPIKKRFIISLSAGYNLEIAGKYKLNGSKGAESDLLAKFTGPRASISVDFSF